MSKRAKRGYSRDFTAKTERRLQVGADRVPATLHEAFGRKCRAVNVSQRNVILRFLKAWVDGTIELPKDGDE